MGVRRESNLCCCTERSGIVDDVEPAIKAIFAAGDADFHLSAMVVCSGGIGGNEFLGFWFESESCGLRFLLDQFLELTLDGLGVAGNGFIFREPLHLLGEEFRVILVADGLPELVICGIEIGFVDGFFLMILRVEEEIKHYEPRDQEEGE